MGDWHGTGYIVTNPETGAGAYMISGGLNGGSVKATVYLAYLAGIIADVTVMAMIVSGIIGMLACVWVPGIDLIMAGSVLMLIMLFEQYVNYIQMCARYLETGDEELGEQIQQQALTSVTNLILSLIIGYLISYMVDWYVSEDNIVDGEIIDGENGGNGGSGTGNESGGSGNGGSGTGNESGGSGNGESGTGNGSGGNGETSGGGNSTSGGGTTSEGGSNIISKTDRVKIDSWYDTPSDELYLKYKDVFDNPKYYNQTTGEINWPIYDGFVNNPVDEILQPGTRIDMVVILVHLLLQKEPLMR